MPKWHGILPNFAEADLGSSAVSCGENLEQLLRFSRRCSHGELSDEGALMQRHIYKSLPCQYCEKPERRVHWREGKPVTCFSCKMRRRSELAKLSRRDAAGRTAATTPSLQIK